MQPLNNLDVIILVITAVSALIALCRGLVKEVLSIVGWILAA
ncbi:MAG: CvpA family protein, partial [Alphaproteobacteria bacterium]|nr:CvpA family protein [Alphaproteobacteria bacterium]